MNPNKTRFFRHYKNKPYRYLGIVRHSETLEEMALYETLYENKLGTMWARPKDMFFENVVIEGKDQARFAPIAFEFKKFEEFNPDLLPAVKSIYKASFKTDLNEEKFMSKIQAHKNFGVFLAYENKNAVAMKIGFKMDQERFYSWMGAVTPEFQGLGIASELMQLQHEWCKTKGFKVIETRTRNQYKQMIALNLNQGFEIVGTLKDVKGVKIIFEKGLS